MEYSSISNQIKSSINSLGRTVRIKHAAGGTTTTKGVWGKIEEGEFDDKAASMLTRHDRIIYIPAIKKVPEAGDLLIMDNIEYGINSVVVYMPTNIPLAYKIGVSN
jgi:hypothetical protein